MIWNKMNMSDKISSEDSGNQDESQICVQGTGQYWMLVIFGPSSGTALKTDISLCKTTACAYLVVKKPTSLRA